MKSKTIKVKVFYESTAAAPEIASSIDAQLAAMIGAGRIAKVTDVVNIYEVHIGDANLCVPMTGAIRLPSTR